ncbi:MAG: hypothetical protein HXY39_07650 [Chloroflexi bacterium]|nr:hypothetical protein [Chloroflexota bacterium]
MSRASRPIQFGALISDHPQAVVGSRGRMIQSYVALGIGVVLMIAGLIAFLVMAEAAGQQALICLGFAGFCALGLGLVGFFDARNTRDMSLKLYEHGLHYADKSGQKTWGWEEIDAIFHYQTINPQTRFVRHSYKVVHRSGDSIFFYDHVRNAAAAYETIRQKIYPLLLPRLQATYAAGQPVAFGMVAVEPAGLRVKGKSIPWNEIAGIHVSGGSLIIERPDGGWFNDLDVPVGNVANVELLLQFVRPHLIR